MNYEDMLKQAREKIPEPSKNTERFEIPKVRGQIEGNKTIISNFNQIAEHIARPAQHLLKYVQRELATPGIFRKQAVIFGSKISASKINDAITNYVNEFVICKECNKPDTKLNKEGDIYYMKCQACGAKHTFTSKI
ncbi:translation initiation factor IF-2 subunit beta [Candidatus Woesearchaeota archaeon]|nr:translation initiation factor IF-2 subunit beta [Candidatus Woesearchaeota archaeon]